MKLEEMIEIFENEEMVDKEAEHFGFDFCAMTLLNFLVPQARPNQDMISCAEHDQIWFSVDPEKLAEVITKKQILFLKACGIHYDTSVDSLSKFC